MLDLARHANGKIHRHGPVHRALGPGLKINDQQIRSRRQLVHDIPAGIARRSVFGEVGFDVAFVADGGGNGGETVAARDAADAGRLVEALRRRFGVNAFAVRRVRGDVSFTWRKAVGGGALFVGHVALNWAERELWELAF